MDRKSGRRVLLAVCIAAALWSMSLTTLAAPPLPSPSASPSGAPGAKVQDYNVKMTADSLKYDDKRKLLVLDGHVTFTHGDTVMTAPHAEFLTEQQVGHLTGGVRVTQPGTTLTGQKLDAFYVERKAIMTGSVQMVTERAPTPATGSKPTARASSSPAPSPSVDVGVVTETVGKIPPARKTAAAPAQHLPTVLLTDQLIYYWEKNEGDAIGNVKIRQGDKRAYSDRAHYTGAVNQIRMFSNVRFERGDHDTMVSEEAIVDLTNQTFLAQGDVEATVLVERTPSPAPALRTPHGDRVMRPSPPAVEERPAPDGLPGDVVPPSDSGIPSAPPSQSSPAR